MACSIYYYLFIVFLLHVPQVLTTNRDKNIDSNSVVSNTPDSRKSSLEKQFSKITTSKWISYMGCGSSELDKYDTLTKVQKTFLNYSKDANGNASDFITNDMNDCALKCSSMAEMNFLIYFKTVCYCGVNVPSEIELNDSRCEQTCSVPTEVYCKEGNGLMVFEISETEKDDIPENIFSFTPPAISAINKWYCFILQSDQFETEKNCKRNLNRSDKCIEKNIVVLKNEKYIQWECDTTTNIKRFRVVLKEVNDHLGHDAYEPSTRSSKMIEIAEDNMGVNTSFIVENSTDEKNTVSEGYISSLQLKIKASKWVSYAGCGYWKLNRHDTQSKVQEKFRNYTDGESSNFITDDIDECALKCSSIAKMKYFSYYKTVCHCAFDISVKAELINPLCKKRCPKPYKRYCGSGIGSMVFEFSDDIEEEMPKHVYSTKPSDSVLNDWYCLTGQNEQYKDKEYCEKILKSAHSCKEKDMLVVLKNDKFVQWKCNITRNFRVIQRTWTEEITMRTVTETTGDFQNDTIPSTEKSTSETYWFISTVVVAGALGSIILFLLLIIRFLHKQLRNALYTTLTAGRDQHLYAQSESPERANQGYIDVIDLPVSRPISVSGQFQNMGAVGYPLQLTEEEKHINVHDV